MRGLAGSARNVHPEIWARWLQIVGKEMYMRCFPLALKKGTLVIGVSNSSWLHELSYLKTHILDRLAEEVGPDVVSDLRLVLDNNVGTNRAQPGERKDQ